ncbi:hypothetical protein LAZ67_X002874 [Cordylochernes scorpioides]|uniref:Integrase catalytic domain-containing protein n=1 Tax=Cordylochernes scorpioides TaxID=51811 RepID=A0ABY6LU72_9ARAC|nr:hypothetical protein LAZ67_X002874 [Cordylochernes scorpioides]
MIDEMASRDLKAGNITQNLKFHVIDTPLPFGILSLNSIKIFLLIINCPQLILYQDNVPLPTTLYKFTSCKQHVSHGQVNTTVPFTKTSPPGTGCSHVVNSNALIWPHRNVPDPIFNASLSSSCIALNTSNLGHCPYNLHKVLHQFAPVFATNKYDVPRLKLPPVKINTTSDKVIALRPYRVPLYDQLEIQTQIEQMLEHGIITTSVSPYASLMTLVTKRDKSKRLLSDRASAFTSEKFRKFLLSRCIQPLLTTSNNPQANGLIERLNATITGKLRLLYIENPKTSWTKLIKQFVQIYNQSPHTVTGFPPIFLMSNSIPPELKNHYNPFPDVQKARQLAFSRTELNHERDKQRYDKGHQTPHFEIGDLVLVKKL